MKPPALLIGRPGCILFLALLALPHPIAPAVIVVDGTCTLADAITAANTDTASGGCPAGSGADDVVLTGDVILTAVDNTTDEGDNGLPTITSDITLEGEGFTIVRDDVAPSFRILQIETTGALTLNNATLSNGHAEYFDYGPFGDGGAIFNSGTVTLIGSTISNSRAGNYYPGFFLSQGGGIYNAGSLYAYYSAIVDNRAYAYYGDAGGGIRNTGTATLVSSTISGNRTRGEYPLGGGISTNGVLTISNSTISGNFGNYGGAISGTATLVNSTVAENEGGHDEGYPGEALWGTFTLYNTLLSNVFPGSHNCSATIIDGGNNLANDATCEGIPDTLAGLDPLLADNGGPTLTHALLPGSNAIDLAGDCGLETDQRGFPRDDGACDSGSVEFSQGDPCVLEIQMSSPAVQSGGTLEFTLFLQHNRPATVTVPFRIWVEDQDGSFIVGRTTPPITFEQGDTFRRRLTLALPESLGTGRYFVRAEIDQMQQGVARATGQIRVVE